MKLSRSIALAAAFTWTLLVTESVVAQSSVGSHLADRCLANADNGGQVFIAAAKFLMGNDATYPEESPAHPVSVSAFWLDTHEVTNAQFANFVAQTGYVLSLIHI